MFRFGFSAFNSNFFSLFFCKSFYWFQFYSSKQVYDFFLMRIIMISIWSLFFWFFIVFLDPFVKVLIIFNSILQIKSKVFIFLMMMMMMMMILIIIIIIMILLMIGMIRMMIIIIKLIIIIIVVMMIFIITVIIIKKQNLISDPTYFFSND